MHNPTYRSLITQMISCPHPSPQTALYHQYCQTIIQMVGGMVEVFEDFRLADTSTEWYEVWPAEYMEAELSHPFTHYGDGRQLFGFDAWL